MKSFFGAWLLKPINTRIILVSKLYTSLINLFFYYLLFIVISFTTIRLINLKHYFKYNKKKIKTISTICFIR
jgi:hypothetical protein